MERIFVIAFVLHTISQVSRGWYTRVFVPNAIFEGVYFLPWCLGLLIMAARLFRQDRNLIHSLLVPLCFFSLIAVLYPKGIFPPSPLSQTIFASCFFFFEALAHACFAAGAWFSFLYLCRNERAGQIFDCYLIWGFILYSLAQVVGSIWSYLGWANLFMWNQRHMQSAALWCCYAGYLHLRFRPTWNTHKKAWFSLAGFLLLFIFSYGGHWSEMNMPRLGG